jgi:hypothetical protein
MNFLITGDGNSLYINFVPEPGSGTLMLGSSAIAMLRGRRRA